MFTTFLRSGKIGFLRFWNWFGGFVFNIIYPLDLKFLPQTGLRNEDENCR